jgi:hypothetical protein
MLIIRKNEVNNPIATVSMNKTLSNPYYLFSFQHIASKERVSFVPQVLSANCRYDKFRFTEAPTTNLSLIPPSVNFPYLGQYYYSIYEQLTSGNTNPALAFNKLESGRAVVIVGNDTINECIFEPYISNDEDFANVIYVSDDEEGCINVTPSVTPTNTPTGTPINTPNLTPTNTSTPTVTPTNTPTITPSQTSNQPIDPNTLNALWWLDYTALEYVEPVGAFSRIGQCVNRTGNPIFKTLTSTGYRLNGPVWFSTGYNGVSGATNCSGSGLASLSGDYNTTITEYTQFFHFNGQGSTAFGMVSESNNTVSDYSGRTQSYNWFELSDNIPDVGGNVIRTSTWYDTGSVSPEPIFNYTPEVWYKGATRVYQSGSSAHTEVWIDGVIVSSTVNDPATLYSANNPVFQVCNNGNGVILTEQFFFDYKLSDVDMGIMFNYLDNKYPVPPTPTPTVTTTPTITPTITPSQSCQITTQYLNSVVEGGDKIRLTLWNDSGYTSSTVAICDYTISGTMSGSSGTTYTSTRTFTTGDHQIQFNFTPFLQPGEVITYHSITAVDTSLCICPVIVNFIYTPPPS